VIALHTGCLPHTDIVTDLRLARNAGFDGIELSIPKLLRHVEGGYRPEQIASSLGTLSVTMLDALLAIERRGQEQRSACERVAEIAAVLGCTALQVVALDDFADFGAAEMRRVLVAALSELSDVAAPHGIRLALEPVSFSPFRQLDQALEVVMEVGVDRAGIVLDTWHLWAADVPWEQVAALDPSSIVCAHLGDGHPRSGATWSDADRNALPGDGVVPLKEGIEAIRATGFAGPWSVEILGHVNLPPAALAIELVQRARRLLEPAPYQRS
jgi:sugar phosphate isomerase/epimerase